ncbi:hypothetical protein [Nocardiopsis lambiniae]|uniref:Uncharacterized protein n=1 Tax=Nocardiopsis lambiniae TaxID=3075539 RepID=A0ABU2MGZ0_9ACTN|nr:hypothetical protein [Nocardiopsis sp. DSM 44743]MDT0331979.1 hypothetical protein [Nocardiopsis sp. DSM 44743]
MVATRFLTLPLALLLAGCGGGAESIDPTDGGTREPGITDAPAAPPSPEGEVVPQAPAVTPSPTGEPAPPPSAPATDATEPATGEPPAETVTGYLEALAATDDPDRVREGLHLTVEGSAAHQLLLHTSSIAQAWSDGGVAAPPTSLNRTDDGAELCPALGNDPDCGEYTGFTGRDTLITGLRINGSDPGPSLIVGEDVTADSEGVNATLITAYRSVVDHVLVVTVEFEAAEDLSLDLEGTAYRAEDGSEQRVEDAAGRRELDAETATHAVFHLPDALPGGELVVGGCLAECSALVDLRLPVR